MSIYPEFIATDLFHEDVINYLFWSQSEGIPYIFHKLAKSCLSEDFDLKDVYYTLFRVN